MRVRGDRPALWLVGIRRIPPFRVLLTAAGLRPRLRVLQDPWEMEREGHVSQPDDLLERIRHRILAGHLPKEGCLATWYGKGTGLRCMACDQAITLDQVEVECDLPDGSTVRLHSRCYDVWSREVSAT